MGTLSTWFQFKGTLDEAVKADIPEIFPMNFAQDTFVKIDVEMIYAKILTDVLERTHGLDDDQVALLWDNCLASNKKDGLITMLAKSMSDKKELFIVYDKAVEVIREATGEETNRIRDDYKTKAESDVGIFISFKNYSKSDMVKLYSGLEYATICSLYKSMNLSKAIQIKMSDLRMSTGAGDAAEAVAQAKSIARALTKGKDTLLDAKDSIETSKVDLAATKESIGFLDAKRSFYLGLPAAYINGEQTGGLGTTGENDTKAVERGLKSYWFAILKPVLEELFDVDLKYKSQDFRQITQALEAMKVFDLVGEEYLSFENKKKIIEGLLDIDAEDNLTTEIAPPPKPPIVPVPVPPGAKV
jgi:hypothetical protein